MTYVSLVSVFLLRLSFLFRFPSFSALSVHLVEIEFFFRRLYINQEWRIDQQTTVFHFVGDLQIRKLILSIVRDTNPGVRQERNGFEIGLGG